LVEPRHHVRQGVKSAPEDALRKCESIYPPEAIAIRPPNTFPRKLEPV
jgi:hypothetical protein